MSDLYTIELTGTVEEWTVEVIGNPSLPAGGAEGQLLAKASGENFHASWIDPGDYQAAIDTAVASLVAASPAALDTLYELAAALGNDPNFATTVTNLLATKYQAGSSINVGGFITDGQSRYDTGAYWTYNSSTASIHRTALGLGGMATQDPAAVSITGGNVMGIASMTLLNASTGAYSLRIVPSTTMTGNRQLTLALGDVNRSLVMTGNATLNQDVSSAGSPVFTGLRISSSTPPATATAAGSAGQMAWDSSYLYVCTATNVWKRAALATW